MKFGSDFVFRKDSHATALLRNWFTLTPVVGTERPCPTTSTSEGTSSEVKTSVDGVSDRPDVAEEMSERHDTAAEPARMERRETTGRWRGYR